MTIKVTTGARTAPARLPAAPPWVRALDKALTSLRDYPAGLAACRRGLGKSALDVPAMWPYLVPALDAVPEQRGSGYRRAVEATCHHTLALYATHQQSRQEPMHVRRPGWPPDSVGRACGDLRAALERRARSPEGVTRRFLASATADSVDELAGHLRGLVPQLRENAIPLDYAQLAQDLAAWHRPDRRVRVRRRWGLDFYRSRQEDPGTDQPEESADDLA